jgi:hypothetical protein
MPHLKKSDLKAIIAAHNHNPVLEALMARRTPNEATCPQCNGTLRMPVPETSRQWATVIAGYDPVTDTFACNNCGAQHMFGKATGQVFTRADGTPCLHEYIGTKTGNCLYRYDCKHCPESHSIDSGD